MAKNPQTKEVSEKPVASDHAASPSKVGSEAINSPEYAKLGPKEYASLAKQNAEMEEKGTLPKLPLNLDVSNMTRGLQEMGDAVGQIANHDYGKDLQQRLAELASELDAGLGKLIHGNAGDKAQPNFPNESLGVIQDLKDRPMNSYNCHFLVKSHIEGAPPEESTAKARNEQVTPNYLNQHGYEEVKDGKNAKPGDIILVEDTGADGKGHYYNHSAIVSATDGKGHVTQTLQKLHPDAPVATLNPTNFKNTYAPDSRYKIHIYRNPAKEGHLE